VRHVFPLLALVTAGCAPLLTFDDPREAAAVAKAEELLVYANHHASRTDGLPLEDLDVLAQYAADGEKALTDPWGQKFKFRYVFDQATETERLVIWATEPRSGKVIAAPRQFAPLVETAN
jgi:hypothetical protein